MIDTCQAASMYQRFYSPNILAVASSLVGEDSLSHHVDPAIGVYIIDRYTYYALEFLETVTQDSKKTMGEFLEVCPRRLCISTVGKRTDLFGRDPKKVPITDFFGSVRNVELTREVIQLTQSNETTTSLELGNCYAVQDENCENGAKSYEYVAPVFHYGSSLPILDELDDRKNLT